MSEDDDAKLPEEEPEEEPEGVVEARKCVVAAKGCVKSGRFQEAAEAYTKALESMPTAFSRGVSQLYYRRGRVWLRLDRAELGVRDFRAAVRLEPGIGRLYLALGAGLMRLGQFADASATLVEGFKYAQEASLRRRFNQCLEGLREHGVAYGLGDKAKSSETSPRSLLSVLGEHNLKSTEGKPPRDDEEPTKESTSVPVGALEDEDVKEALASEAAFLNIQDVAATEAQFWKTHGLELREEDFLEETLGRLRAFKDAFGAVFRRACLVRATTRGGIFEPDTVPIRKGPTPTGAYYWVPPPPPPPTQGVLKPSSPTKEKDVLGSLSEQITGKPTPSRRMMPPTTTTTTTTTRSRFTPSRPTARRRSGTSPLMSSMQEGLEEEEDEEEDDDGSDAGDLTRPNETTEPVWKQNFSSVPTPDPEEKEEEKKDEVFDEAAQLRLPPELAVEDAAGLTMRLGLTFEIPRTEPPEDVCLGDLLAKRSGLSGSECLTLLREIHILALAIDENHGVIALAQTLGAIPFSTAVLSWELGEDVVEKLKTKTPAEWADEMAPNNGPEQRSVRFPQFLEVCLRITAARYRPVVPEYLTELQKERQDEELKRKEAAEQKATSKATTESDKKEEDEAPRKTPPKQRRVSRTASGMSTASRKRFRGRDVNRTKSGLTKMTEEDVVSPPEEDSEESDVADTASVASSSLSIASSRGRAPTMRSTSKRWTQLRRAKSIQKKAGGGGKKKSKKNRKRTSKDEEVTSDAPMDDGDDTIKAVQPAQEQPTEHRRVSKILAQFTTLPATRKAMPIAFLADRLYYGISRYILLQSEVLPTPEDRGLGTAALVFVDFFQWWLRLVFRHYARSHPNDDTYDPRIPVMDIREFLFMLKDLRLLDHKLSLRVAARTLLCTVDFVGDPRYDRLNETAFARALFYCVDIKTFDGLVPAIPRVTTFMDNVFFPNVSKYTGLPVFRGPTAESSPLEIAGDGV